MPSLIKSEVSVLVALSMASLMLFPSSISPLMFSIVSLTFSIMPSIGSVVDSQISAKTVLEG